MGILSGLAGGISSLIGPMAGLAGGIISNRTQEKIARQNREWATNMANTTFQRGYKDMMAAGINPMLMARAGGDPTPSGNFQPNTQNPAAGFSRDWSQMMNSSTARAQQRSQQQLQSAQITTQGAMSSMYAKQGQAALSQAGAAQTNANANMAMTLSNIGVNKQRIPQIIAATNASQAQANLAAQQQNYLVAQTHGQQQQNRINEPAAIGADNMADYLRNGKYNQTYQRKVVPWFYGAFGDYGGSANNARTFVPMFFK